MANSHNLLGVRLPKAGLKLVAHRADYFTVGGRRLGWQAEAQKVMALNFNDWLRLLCVLERSTKRSDNAHASEANAQNGNLVLLNYSNSVLALAGVSWST